MQASENLILTLISRMEHGFGRLEEGQRQNRQSSEQRTKDLHKRMDRLEDHTKSEFREIRSKMERVKVEQTSTTSYLKVASHLVGNWQTYLSIVFVIVGLMLGKNAETIKAWLGALKQ